MARRDQDVFADRPRLSTKFTDEGSALWIRATRPDGRYTEGLIKNSLMGITPGAPLLLVKDGTEVPMDMKQFSSVEVLGVIGAQSVRRAK